MCKRRKVVEFMRNEERKKRCDGKERKVENVTKKSTKGRRCIRKREKVFSSLKL